MAAINPAVPFTVPLNLLRPGDFISVNGVSPHAHGSFSINFETDSGDTAFHFNPRFNKRHVIRNAKIFGNWGNEEHIGGFPFQEGQPFEITVQATEHHYKVAVNGVHYIEFNHRLPIGNVQRLSINGDVQLRAVRYPGNNLQSGSFGPAQGMGPSYQGMPMQGQGFGSPFTDMNVQAPGYGLPYGGVNPSAPGYGAGMNVQVPGYGAGMNVQAPGMGPHYAGQNQSFGFAPTPAGPSAPVFNPPTPYIGPIVGGLYPGRMIRVSGVGRGSRFSINLQSGANQGANIALHVDVRFHYGNEHNVVVRNSHINGSWGAEERQGPSFPFVHNAPFELIILVEPSAFKVAVNNQHYTEFMHRLQPLGSIDCIHIIGDVQISVVQIQ